jgi:hypothetical protein
MSFPRGVQVRLTPEAREEAKMVEIATALSLKYDFSPPLTPLVLWVGVRSPFEGGATSTSTSH